MARLLIVALFLALAMCGAGRQAGAATEREQILHASGTPQTVVGPQNAERMSVTVRGVTRVAGRAVPVGASSLGHGVTAVALPADLGADEPIFVRTTPAEAGPAHLLALDAAVRPALDGARAAGFMLGVFAAIALLQIAAFVITRERSIVWYLGVLACLAGVELVRDGLFPVLRSAPGQMLLVLDLITTICIVGFTSAYLRLWREHRAMFWLLAGALLATIAVGLVTTLAPALRPETEVLRPPLLLAFGLVLLGIIVLRAMAFPPAWILLGGVFGLFLSVAYRAIRGVAGTAFLDRWAYEIGATIDALVFAVAIIAGIRYAIYERRSIQRRLDAATHDAMHDDLTGVLNRRGLFTRAEPIRSGTLFSIDLDEFKAVNDLYGHAAGDAVLVSVAEVLRTAVGESDLVARVGGDEFVIVAPRISLSGAKTVAEYIAAAIAAISPNSGHARVDGFGASIGYVALDGLAFENALRLADTHAYRIKQSRRTR